MSLLVTVRTALAMMRRAVSPMPIGLTPGFLSSAMRRQASRGEIHGSRKVEQRRLAVRAKEWQRALEAVLKDVHSLLQVYASSPDGPAAPLDGHQGAHPVRWNLEKHLS